MQKTLHQVSDVTFFFLIVLGGLHISASLLVAQGVIQKTDLLLFHVLDLPFLLMALVYGVSKLALTIEGITGQLKRPLIICSIFAGVLFLIALVLNFGFADAQFL